MFRFNHSFTVDNNFITFDRNYFTGIFIYKVLNPCFQNTGSQFTTNNLLQIGFIHLNVFCQIEDFKNILIILKTDSSQQRCNGQFLLTVDVGIHDIVDVRSKFNPGSLEGDDTS